MALTDAAYLEQVKLARDVVMAGIVDGSRVVTYSIRGREVTREPTNDLLKALREEIEFYERRASRSSKSPWKLAALHRPGGSS